MRIKIIFSIFVFAFVILISIDNMMAQSKKNIDKKEIPGILSDTLKFKVYGMDCPGCASGLEKQINKIDAIKFSKANWLKQELKVVLHKDSTLNLKLLKKRIKKSNFTLAK